MHILLVHQYFAGLDEANYGQESDAEPKPARGKVRPSTRRPHDRGQGAEHQVAQDGADAALRVADVLHRAVAEAARRHLASPVRHPHWVRWAAGVAACALPRPSATASAKLAKSTVNHSQIASCVTNPRNPGSAVKIPTVVRAAPTMVTNMTGFFTINRGFSFLNASPIAGPTMFQSKSDAGFCVMSFEPRR